MCVGCDVAAFCWTMVLGNDMGAEGAKALAPALSYLTQLTDLYLSGAYDNL